MALGCLSERMGKGFGGIFIASDQLTLMKNDVTPDALRFIDNGITFFLPLTIGFFNE
jgi:hypothetical protein